MVQFQQGAVLQLSLMKKWVLLHKTMVMVLGYISMGMVCIRCCNINIRNGSLKRKLSRYRWLQVLNVTLAATTNFTAAGRILVESELISYASISSPNLQSIVRNVNGTDNAAHNTGTAVTDATNFSDWGEGVLASEVTLEPGLWSLDNFGQVLVATIANGKTFTWNAGAASPLTVRASTSTSGFSTASNPTASRLTLYHQQQTLMSFRNRNNYWRSQHKTICL